MKHIADYFSYARERYSILLKRRAGVPAPWTTDPVLSKYRFCNVFRQDDIVTQWIVENLCKPLSAGGNLEWNLIPVLCAARFINRVPTLNRMKDILLEEGWHSKACVAILKDIKKSGKPLITGAYMVRTPYGMDKSEGLDVILKPVQDWAEIFSGQGAPVVEPNETLQQAHAWLCEFEYFGSFMAYEVVTDLSYCRPFTDVMTWANAGPGCARGCSRLEFGEIGHYSQGNVKHQVRMQEMMQEIVSIANSESSRWPADWPRWDMRTAEHTFCEYDKYMRAIRNEGEPKQLYRGA